jgi:hypothetical protein
MHCEAKYELDRLLIRLREKREQAEERLTRNKIKLNEGGQPQGFLNGAIMELEFQLQDLSIIELHLSEISG